jgi:hypothetical protein
MNQATTSAVIIDPMILARQKSSAPFKEQKLLVSARAIG